MQAQDIILAFISLVSSTTIVLLFLSLGWYCIWKIFLSKFKLVRELLGQNNGDGKDNNDQPDRHRPRRVRRD